MRHNRTTLLCSPSKLLVVCETLENDDLNQGERIGMIRFGSRADLYFENYKPLVKLEQRAVAGETLIARKV